MSSVKSPAEKKRLAYERDHYNRNGQSNKAWRKTKPVKKAKARCALRKAANDRADVCVADDEVPIAATRKNESVQQRRILDWGSIALRDFVASHRERRETTIGAKQRRKAKAKQPVPPLKTKTKAT